MYTEDDKDEDYEYSDNNDYNTDNKLEEVNKDYEIADDSNYMNYDIYTESHNQENKRKKKQIDKRRLFKLAIILILLIILFTLVYFIITTGSKTPSVNILNREIILNAGESSAIAYEILDTEEEIRVRFASSDERIVSAYEDGSIVGVSTGEATITVSYYVGNTLHEEECHVTVK